MREYNGYRMREPKMYKKKEFRRGDKMCRMNESESYWMNNKMYRMREFKAHG
jgi:hypothetical protein